MLWVRHNMRINLKPINQHIPVMMTLTFIHVRSTQCACVSKLNTDVMITKHSLVDQRYGPDVSNCISSVIAHMAPLCNPRQRDSWRHMTPYHTAPLCNPRQRDGWRHMTSCHTAPLCNPRLRDSWRYMTPCHTAPLCNLRQRDGWRHMTSCHMTPWEGHIRQIGLESLSNHTQRSESLKNHTQPPKSLIKSVEIFPKSISYRLVDHTQSVKPLHVSEEKSNEDTLNSPYQAHDTGTRNDTWGKCPWLPHHNQCPEVHGKPHEILFGLKDNKNRAVGDNFSKRKEIGIKDRYKRTQFRRTQDLKERKLA